MTFENQLTQFLIKGDSLSDDVATKITDDFADSIPYSTLTGDDDTLDNWIFDNYYMIVSFYSLDIVAS